MALIRSNKYVEKTPIIASVENATFNNDTLNAIAGHYYLIMTNGSYTVTSGGVQMDYISISSSKCPSILKATDSTVVLSTAIQYARDLVLGLE